MFLRQGHTMKGFLLFLGILLGWASWANAAYHDAPTSVRKGEEPGTYLITTTLNDIAPIPSWNACHYTTSNTGYSCGYVFGLYSAHWDGNVYPGGAMISIPLVDRTPPNQCNTSNCNTSLATAQTIGELVPLMKLRGGFGVTKSALYRPGAEGKRPGFKTCIYSWRASAIGNVDGGLFDCSELIPLTASCDILDTDAVVDFGPIRSDVASRQASGSFKVNCSNDTDIRVKFASSVTDMKLSQDGKLSVSLKVRNAKPGVNSLESFVTVVAGTQEIFIDGDLKNANTSHTGPFSASVVAIVEVA
ncbi:hypothetical protein NGC47_15380 [Serratia marcescens]|uniref:hypothetical protein n=1 Tax=Serratia TaxID=613 RepID=UPI0018D85FA6|nr:hypothetical protein [Serratia marcescens]MBH2935275.1 hypothetical protein [Serratia marcescens]MBH3264202.1 hypothetical protein [Serratia marcescens]MEB7511760.1 hypothetical protein [Serratia marcescens]UYU04360.1 hypothetical protein OHY99_01570 [Serratia marcescens]